MTGWPCGMWQMIDLLALETAAAGQALIDKSGTAAAAATNTKRFTARSLRQDGCRRNLAEFTPPRNAIGQRHRAGDPRRVGVAEVLHEPHGLELAQRGDVAVATLAEWRAALARDLGVTTGPLDASATVASALVDREPGVGIEPTTS